MFDNILNFLHMILLFIPVFIFFVPFNYVTHHFKFLILGILLTPLHWPLFDNQCIFTIFTKKMGGLQEAETDSPFSEVYMRWFYEPFIKLFGYKWNSKNLETATYIHWIFIFIFLWYYIFYYNTGFICN